MFDAKRFAANFRPAGVTVCNSEHPLWPHIVDKTTRNIPGDDDLTYIRSVSDKWVASYRRSDKTVCVWEVSFVEFKGLVKAGTNSATLGYEPVAVPPTDKYIGNAIFRDLRMMKLV